MQDLPTGRFGAAQDAAIHRENFGEDATCTNYYRIVFFVCSHCISVYYAAVPNWLGPPRPNHVFTGTGVSPAPVPVLFGGLDNCLWDTGTKEADRCRRPVSAMPRSPRPSLTAKKTAGVLAVFRADSSAKSHWPPSELHPNHSGPYDVQPATANPLWRTVGGTSGKFLRKDCRKIPVSMVA